MKTKMKILNTEEIELLKKHFSPLKFNSPFNLVYEQQIPNTGVVLLSGKIELYKKNKIETIQPGTMLGVHQILNDEPVKQGCKIKENTEVLLLEKSDILKLGEKTEDQVSKIFKAYDA